MEQIDIPTAMATTAIGAVLGSHVAAGTGAWLRRELAPARRRRRTGRRDG